MTATNGAGTGTASTPSAAVIPFTVPDRPTGVSATPGDTTADVTWTPGSDEGSAITGYDVTATDHTNGPNGGEICSTTGATGCTVHGLTDGDSYTFSVTATNGAGTGAASLPSAAVTPFTVPDPPTGVSATPGDTTADVTWTPGFDEGSAITGYTVTATDAHDPGQRRGDLLDVGRDRVHGPWPHRRRLVHVHGDGQQRGWHRVAIERLVARSHPCWA